MKFTEKTFAKWLADKNDREKAGNPENIQECPLCNFLKAQGTKSVYMNFIDRTVDGVNYMNPNWADKFQRATCKHVGYDQSRYITAKTALSYLK